MLVDANILVYAVDEAAPEHDRAAAWLEAALNGNRRVGLPWESLLAFMRLTTNARIVRHPLAPEAAWGLVEAWLAAPTAWVPLPTDRHAAVLGELIATHRPAGRLVPDSQLVALAIQHGAEVISADTDFARFTEVRWSNPLAGA
jgi:toxin-antitoxin system PIN domain toxin